MISSLAFEVILFDLFFSCFLVISSFSVEPTYKRKILALPPREVYSFVLNNDSRLKHAVREAMAAEVAQLQLDMPAVSEFEFHIPHSEMVTGLSGYILWIRSSATGIESRL